MVLMDYRAQQLQEAWLGLQQTGVPLVSLHQGRFQAAGFSDDLGLYYFVPKVAALFHLNLDQAVTVFLGGGLALACVIALIGFFLLFRSWLARATAAIALGLLTYWGVALISDVYVFQAIVPLMILPYAILIAKNSFAFRPLLVFFFASGLLIGFSNFVRSQSGLAAGLALLFLAVVLRTSRLRRLTLVACLGVGVIIPMITTAWIFHQRDVFLRANAPEALVGSRHPLWHSVYIGFGYLNNPFGIQYLDGNAAEKVRVVNPSAEYLSPTYESILSQEVVTLVKKHPWFVYETVMSKMGAIIGWFIVFANFGLVVFWFVKKEIRVETIFALSLLGSSLPSIFVIPTQQYSFGFISIAVLFGVYHLGLFFTASPFIQRWAKNTRRTNA